MGSRNLHFLETVMVNEEKFVTALSALTLDTVWIQNDIWVGVEQKNNIMQIVAASERINECHL
jgi:hypothetical protein